MNSRLREVTFLGRATLQLSLGIRMQIVLLVTDRLETRSYAEKELILNIYRI